MELEGNWGFLFLLFFPLIGSEKKSKKTKKKLWIQSGSHAPHPDEK
jgi:hypothetical protein